MPPDCLTLELNERIVIDNYQAALPELVELKGLGVSLALDDFGAGYTSLGQLRRLPLDVLKIDKGLVDGLGGAPEDARIVSAIISLAHILDLTVLAEGVERAEQLSILRSLGCDAAQGFLLS
ncbi:MAG TPA: EAL domain-containing protein, partial [Mycobacteriales bacterium]|nr:EAL domain-containing protein [Mycobacteriales bacterium]